MPDLEVDARGLLCPLPVLRLARALRKASGGTVVLLLATDPASAGDVEAFCQERGNSLLSAEREGTIFRFRVRKN
ncbi:MAG: sulfurtransferase TusA family protein [Acidobacteriota bacterium]